MKKTTIKLSYDNFWNLERYRAKYELSSKDEALRKLFEDIKKVEKNE